MDFFDNYRIVLSGSVLSTWDTNVEKAYKEDADKMPDKISRSVAANSSADGAIVRWNFKNDIPRKELSHLLIDTTSLLRLYSSICTRTYIT